MLAAPPSGAVATYEAAPKFKHSSRKKAERVYRVRLDRCGPMPSTFRPHSLIAEIAKAQDWAASVHRAFDGA
jgi:hypothetical protein